jgi:hypothetical protein
MPIVNGKKVTPEEAIASKHCPECGADLTQVNAVAELNSHWTVKPRDDRRQAEAIKRQNLLMKYIADNHITTSNQPKPKPAAPAAAAQ